MKSYSITFQPWSGNWELVGPVGGNGRLLFTSARDAASHARWDAKAKGGTIKVHDKDGKLFKTIKIEADESGEDGLILPSA
jgi:hypothetical protein